MKTHVLDLGGSIVTGEEGPNIPFLQDFFSFWKNWLQENPSSRLIIVVGGGVPARRYQQAYRNIQAKREDPEQEEELDWIGIAATHLNGRLLKAIFHEYCLLPLVINPTTVEKFKGRVLIGAGWKPGFSTDYDAVLLAEKFGAETIFNLSNISRIYTGDPQKNTDISPLEKLSWKEYRGMIANNWSPGSHVPFDPVAAQKAEVLRLKVIVAAGKDLKNMEQILKGKPFTGTTIGPI